MMWLGGLMKDSVGNEGKWLCLHLLSTLFMFPVAKFSLVKKLKERDIFG